MTNVISPSTEVFKIFTDLKFSPQHTDEDNFKLEEFATKLMSADYFAQANNQELNFHMPDDIHALISDSASGSYTLVCGNQIAMGLSA